MRHYLFIMTVFFLACCEQTASEHQKTEEPKDIFATSDASEMFFNNVRQIYYDLERQDQTKLRIYRYKTRSQAQDKPVINLALVSNWRYDEAYLLIEPNTYLEGQNPLQITWKSKDGKESGQYNFTFGSKEKHLTFAKALYESIQNGHQFLVKVGDSLSPFLVNQLERETFRKTVKDYLVLTGKE